MEQGKKKEKASAASASASKTDGKYYIGISPLLARKKHHQQQQPTLIYSDICALDSHIPLATTNTFHSLMDINILSHIFRFLDLSTHLNARTVCRRSEICN